MLFDDHKKDRRENNETIKKKCKSKFIKALSRAKVCSKTFKKNFFFVIVLTDVLQSYSSKLFKGVF